MGRVSDKYITGPCPSAEDLIESGYRRVSKKYCRLARIDTAGWRERMARKHAPWDPRGEGMEWVIGLGSSAASHYRRCYTRDVIIVPREVARLIPASITGSSPYDYVPLKDSMT